jgi:TonB family protein
MGRYAWLEQQGLIRICLLSFIMHLMVFGGAYGLVSLGSIDKRAEMPIVRTRLVKLGKKRDPKLLPRIAPKKEQQQPKPAPAPKPKETPPEPPPKTKKEPVPVEAKPPPAEVPNAEKILDAFKQENEAPPALDELIKDKIGPLLEEGNEEGSEIGEEISGRLQASYNDRLLAKIKSNLAIPATLTDRERIILKTIVFLSIHPNGGLREADISESSGNPSYDNAVLAAVKKSGPFAVPPPSEAGFYKDGIRFGVCPVSCQ